MESRVHLKALMIFWLSLTFGRLFHRLPWDLEGFLTIYAEDKHNKILILRVDIPLFLWSIYTMVWPSPVSGKSWPYISYRCSLVFYGFFNPSENFLSSLCYLEDHLKTIWSHLAFYSIQKTLLWCLEDDLTR